MEDPKDEITPPAVSFNRRTLLQGGLVLACQARPAGDVVVDA